MPTYTYPPRRPTFQECIMPNCEEDGLNICILCNKNFCYECDEFFMVQNELFYNSSYTGYICFLCFVVSDTDDSPIR